MNDKDGNDTVTHNAKNIAIMTEKVTNMSERFTEMTGNYKSLEKSYTVLNECHHEIEERLVRMEAEWGFTKALVKWVVGGSALSLILNVVTLAKLFGVI